MQICREWQPNRLSVMGGGGCWKLMQPCCSFSFLVHIGRVRPMTKSRLPKTRTSTRTMTSHWPWVIWPRDTSPRLALALGPWLLTNDHESSAQESPPRDYSTRTSTVPYTTIEQESSDDLVVNLLRKHQYILNISTNGQSWERVNGSASPRHSGVSLTRLFKHYSHFASLFIVFQTGHQ